MYLNHDVVVKLLQQLTLPQSSTVELQHSSRLVEASIGCAVEGVFQPPTWSSDRTPLQELPDYILHLQAPPIMKRSQGRPELKREPR
jgi:hypothetical protein